MSSRPERVGDQIRAEITEMLARQIHDPGIGFLTVTRVSVSADLQHARVHYTTLGDDKARRESARALERAAPYLRRQLGRRLGLRRVPEVHFFFDESIEQQDRIERIIQEIQTERATRGPIEGEEQGGPEAQAHSTDSPHDDREDHH
jgi:ribosome-binding factor A